MVVEEVEKAPEVEPEVVEEPEPVVEVVEEPVAAPEVEEPEVVVEEVAPVAVEEPAPVAPVAAAPVAEKKKKTKKGKAPVGMYTFLWFLYAFKKLILQNHYEVCEYEGIF